MLRGSSSAAASNAAIVGCLREALAKVGLPEDAVVNVADTSHEAAIAFMQLNGMIDCLVPRGGHSLIASVREHATVPYVIDGDGNCHVYVDAGADLDMALSIVVNAKTQRPGVCNAAESLVVHEAVAGEFLPRPGQALSGVELRGDGASRAMLPDHGGGHRRRLRRGVPGTDHVGGGRGRSRRGHRPHRPVRIGAFRGHRHQRPGRAAERFCREVDAAAVVVNASTRFVDGGELGLGSEIGISTQKLHARGPMGLRELTCVKYVVHGNGQVRR